MSKLEVIVSAEAERIDLDKMVSMVESQLGNVVGGGYSQYCAWHCKHPSEIESN